MEYFSKKLRKHEKMKKCIKIWKDYEKRKKMEKPEDRRMDNIYRQNLMKKSFFPWRTLTYKDGYASTVQK